jgi:hypothetical protein
MLVIAYSAALFARQFEPDGDGFLYRCRLQGPAIHVTAEERAQFIAGYEEVKGGWRWPTSNWFFFLVIGWIAALALGVKFSLFQNGGDFVSALNAATAVSFAIEKTLTVLRAWSAPMKGLVGRAQVAPAIDSPVLRDATLVARTWRSVGILLLWSTSFEASILWVWFGRHTHDFGTFSWNVILLFFIGKVVRDAFLKWRLETDQHEPVPS